MKNEKEPQIEVLPGGLYHAPGADFVFGKRVKMGTRYEWIFQRAIEDGYRAGVQAHHAHFEATGEIEVLTESEFMEIIGQQLPRYLSDADARMWRAYFIVGWICVALFLAPREEATPQE